MTGKDSTPGRTVVPDFDAARLWLASSLTQTMAARIEALQDVILVLAAELDEHALHLTDTSHPLDTANSADTTSSDADDSDEPVDRDATGRVRVAVDVAEGVRRAADFVRDAALDIGASAITALSYPKYRASPGSE